MLAIEPRYDILTEFSKNGVEELKNIEKIARGCYKSDFTNDSYLKFIPNLIGKKHLAMLEHGYFSVKFTCSRAISHELVRHRMASFAQESQRYCNYSKDRFDNNITFIIPQWANTNLYSKWIKSCLEAEETYMDLIRIGLKPEEAREILPNSCKTEVTVTANYREWRWIFELRCAPNAHPEMRKLMVPLLHEMKEKLPLIFDDLNY